MKRQLIKVEREMTLKGIEKLKKEIADFGDKKELKILARNYELAKRRLEEKLGPYNRKVEDENYKTEMEYIDEQVKAKQSSINEMQKHLKEGVEVKENKSVQ